MAKRKSHKKKYTKRASFFRIRWMIAGFFILGVVFLSYKLFAKSNICANSITCIKNLSSEYESDTESIFLGRSISEPKYLADDFLLRRVLGQATGPKHIYVDLSTQKLSAFEGEKKVMEFPVSTGKWYPTPTGDFKIWIKLRYTRMSGGNPNDGTYYNLANVPYTMFFSGPTADAGRGFSLHGAYWHNNFGYPMSHGCVNIRPEDAGKLFYWAEPSSDGDTTRVSSSNPGTEITIFGQPPI